MCQNRIMFKQFITSGAIDFVQIDSTRLGGVNEVLAVMLMAAKYGKPVCPHAVRGRRDCSGCHVSARSTAQGTELACSCRSF